MEMGRYLPGLFVQHLGFLLKRQRCAEASGARESVDRVLFILMLKIPSMHSRARDVRLGSYIVK